ncbi:MAG: acyltransferase [Clostridia bacterium]|nr:acyltransferase [Clostridia bacterium]
MERKRESWVDIVKGYACILVVLGHFVQSMMQSSIISASFIPLWFEQTVYYFHVPLFFICSGYLYQKYSRVETLAQWKNNFLKKLISLGIPFFTFAGITWLMKTLLAGQVNNEVGGIVDSLFVNPISPYWYLYALFFVFIVTPTCKSKRMAIGLLIGAVAMKGLSFVPMDINFYPLTTLLKNEVWFVIGMNLQVFDFAGKIGRKSGLFVGASLSVVFIILSIPLCYYGIENAVCGFLMGLAGCFATLLLFIGWQENVTLKKVSIWFSKYTLPVYLMHTIFAAGLRGVLFKLGIDSALIHIVLGVTITFAGPIVATMIMMKIKYLDFFIQPTKYIRIGDRKNG